MGAIKNVRLDEMFKRKKDAKKTFVRGKYCRVNSAYECVNFDDINDFVYLKKGTIVYEDC